MTNTEVKSPLLEQIASIKADFESEIKQLEERLEFYKEQPKDKHGIVEDRIKELPKRIESLKTRIPECQAAINALINYHLEKP